MGILWATFELLLILASIVALGLFSVLVLETFRRRFNYNHVEAPPVFEDPNSLRPVPCPNIFDPAEKYISLILPAYNEELRLPGALDETLNYLQARAEKDKAFSYEVIIVDDGSGDATTRVAFGYVKKYSVENVRVILLGRNHGKGEAIRKGMLHSRGELLLMLDADGATKVNDLEKLENQIHAVAQKERRFGESVDSDSTVRISDIPVAAFGSRAHLEEKALATRKWYRNFLMKGFHVVVLLAAGSGIRDTQCGFKMFTRAAARKLFMNIRLKRWCFDVELVYLCKRFNIPMVEISVNWTEIPGSKVNLLSIPNMLWEIGLVSLVCLKVGQSYSKQYLYSVYKSEENAANGFRWISYFCCLSIFHDVIQAASVAQMRTGFWDTCTVLIFGLKQRKHKQKEGKPSKTDTAVANNMDSSHFLYEFKRQASLFFKDKINAARLALLDATPAQILTEEVTNGDSSAPDTRALRIISRAAFEVDDYWRIVDILHRRLLKYKRLDWRAAYKAIILLEHLLTHGPTSVAEEFEGDKDVITEIANFRYVDEKGFNWGESVQRKAERVVKLIEDESFLKEERARARKLTVGIKGFGSFTQRTSSTDQSWGEPKSSNILRWNSHFTHYQSNEDTVLASERNTVPQMTEGRGDELYDSKPKRQAQFLGIDESHKEGDHPFSYKDHQTLEIDDNGHPMTLTLRVADESGDGRDAIRLMDAKEMLMILLPGMYDFDEDVFKEIEVEEGSLPPMLDLPTDDSVMVDVEIEMKDQNEKPKGEGRRAKVPKSPKRQRVTRKSPKLEEEEDDDEMSVNKLAKDDKEAKEQAMDEARKSCAYRRPSQFLEDTFQNSYSRVPTINVVVTITYPNYTRCIYDSEKDPYVFLAPARSQLGISASSSRRCKYEALVPLKGGKVKPQTKQDQSESVTIIVNSMWWCQRGGFRTSMVVFTEKSKELQGCLQALLSNYDTTLIPNDATSYFVWVDYEEAQQEELVGALELFVKSLKGFDDVSPEDPLGKSSI
ncbi:OLC1v1027636C1 [Oldenlandia corymbosa var. corymbosa]|uniref:dolichyl-phosphate beta-glucosyltransferase n=1 Tax=Oldenlandia corymbosa var. corymbosa TaxID=529605 RepID=A0AAV1CBT1_OLDCO|nr:OLC1v1027636C1 [Oldenlandia corymbosa var. corymbosa]